MAHENVTEGKDFVDTFIL